MTVFDTETMAELCVKQGLTDEALAIYRRLADQTAEPDTRRRYAERMAALGSPRDARPMDTPGLRVDRRGDEVEIDWRLPPERERAGAAAPAVEEDAVGDRRRAAHDAADVGGGTTIVVVPDLHSLRAAAGRLRDDGTFIPIVRLSAQAAG